MSFSIIISVGKYGGFYLKKHDHEWMPGGTIRLCLGWIAFDILTPEHDEYLAGIGRAFFPGWDEEATP